MVSGAGSGLGRELARAFAARGFGLALIGRRSEPLRETLALAGAVAGECYACDVRRGADVEAVAERVAADLGPATILVPAAGVAHIAPLAETSSADFAEVVDTNLIGTFHLVRAFLPQLGTRPSAWIFPILSVAAHRGFAGWGAYAASKAGLAGLVTTLREELRGTAIRLTALYPGATDTPLWNALPGSWDRSAMLKVEDVASAIGWVLSLGPSATVEEIHLGPTGGAL